MYSWCLYFTTTEIQELKRKLVAEVRRNHSLESDLQKLDKKIALLIKNRGNIQEVLAKSEHKKKKATDKPPELLSDQKKELYQNLFYLLQTEPKYLANLLYLCSPEEMHEFLDTVILTLFGDAYSPREEYLILSLFKAFPLPLLFLYSSFYSHFLHCPILAHITMLTMYTAHTVERIEELGCCG